MTENFSNLKKINQKEETSNQDNQAFEMVEKNKGDNKDKKNIDINQELKDKEKKENIDFDDYLKAAEILCYLNLKEKDNLKKEELEEIVLKMKEEHSPQVIQQAIKIADLRVKGLALAEKVYSEFNRKNKSSSDYAKEEALRNELNYQLTERKNFYYQEIIYLKKLLLEEKNEKLKKELKENPALAHLSFDEKELDLKNKMKGYETFLVKLVLAELERDNEVKEKIENLKKQESFFYNLFIKFNKLPRTTKAVMGSVIVGGVTATLAPSLVLTTLPLYFTYRAGRAIFGSVFGGFFQKMFNKVVEKAYHNDYKRLGDEFSKILLGEEKKTRILKKEDINNLKKQSKEIDELLQEGDFARLAQLNFEIALEQQKRIKNLESKRKTNYIASSIAMGLLGGFLGSQVFDSIFGSQFVSTNISKENISSVKTSSSSSNLDLATIRKGEGIEHALKRQLLNDPQKFGWDQKTDLNTWANKTAHLIAIKNGYVNPLTGEEVRVFDMNFKGQQNPAYLLEVENGQFKVKEYFLNQEVKGGSSQLNPYEYQYKKEADFLKQQSFENESNINKVELVNEQTGKIDQEVLPSDFRKTVYENDIITDSQNVKLENFDLNNVFELNQEQLILYNDLVSFFNKKVKNLFFYLKDVKINDILFNLDSNYYRPEVKEVLKIFKEVPISEVEKNYTLDQYLRYQVLNKDLSSFIEKIF